MLKKDLIKHNETLKLRILEQEKMITELLLEKDNLNKEIEALKLAKKMDNKKKCLAQLKYQKTQKGMEIKIFTR